MKKALTILVCAVAGMLAVCVPGGAALKPPLSLVWKMNIGAVESAPVVAEGKVIAATGVFGSGKIYLIDLDSGNLLKSGRPNVFWLPGMSGPVYSNGYVYLGVDAHGRIAEPGPKRGIIRYKVGDDPVTGKVITFFDPPGSWPVYGAPKIYDDKLYFLAADFAVYCVDMNGSQVWRYQTQQPVGHERPFGMPDSNVESSPAIAEGAVYIGSRDGSVYALDAGSGALKWRFATGGPVDSSPAVAGNRVVIGSRDGNIYCLDRSTGRKVWNTKTGGWVSSSPAVDLERNRTYVGSYDGNLYALNLNDGRVVWRFKTDWWVLSSPRVADGVVYFGSFDQHIYALDADRGRLLWKFKTDNAVVASPVVTNDRMIIGSCDGYLYCFGPQGTVEKGDTTPVDQPPAHELSSYLEKLKDLDIFEIAEVMGSWLEKNGYYPKPNDKLPDDYVHRRRVIETLLSRGQKALVDGEWDIHELKLALLYDGIKSDPAYSTLQAQFKALSDSYLALWDRYRFLVKSEKENPEEALTTLEELEKSLPSVVSQMESSAGQAQERLSRIVRVSPKARAPGQPQFFYSTQVGVDTTSWHLFPKKPLPDWTIFISAISAKLGVEAHRSKGDDRIYQYTGMRYNYEDVRPEWTKGLVADCRSPQDLYLNPQTGQLRGEINYLEGSNFADEGMRQRYRERIVKIAMRLRNLPAFYAYHLGNEIHLECQDTAISGYGPWPEAYFRNWLKEKYKDIRKLNETWGTSLASFEEAALPVKLPQTQSEHALWEDWVVCREEAMLALQKVFFEAVHSVDNTHPVIDRYLVHSHSPWLCANGWNHYRMAKTVDYVGTHNWYSLRWLNFANDKRLYHTEWTPFFTQALTLRQVQTQMRRMMNDWCAMGQVGWQFFCWVDLVTYGNPDLGIGYYGPLRGFVRYDGLPTVLGFEAQRFIRRSRMFEKEIAGGTETRTPVAILWSQANFRHDFKRLMFDDGSGWYNLFKNIHIGLKVIFDDQLLEGKTDLSGYRVIVVPWIDYLDERVSRMLIEYVRQGGSLIVTGTGASYTGYGKKNLLLAAAAGVAPIRSESTNERITITYAGKDIPLVINRPHCKFGGFFTYQLLEPEKGVIEGTYKDKPVLVKTRLGKGQFLFLGVPLGFQHMSLPIYYEVRSQAGEKLLSDLLAECGVSAPFSSDNDSLTARFWNYQGTEYLFLVNNGQDAGVNFSVAGSRSLVDLLNGKQVPAVKDASGKITFSTDLLFGEGRVFAIQPSEVAQ